MKNSSILIIFLLILIMPVSCNFDLYQKKVTPISEADETSEVLPKNLWTIMVYMAADNDLESAAIEDLNEMENGLLSQEITVLALVDRSTDYDETNGNWSDTRLFKISYDENDDTQIISQRLSCPPLGLTVETDQELDMGNSTVLEKFIDFGKEAFPAEHYALIMWGHGTGWRGQENNTGNKARAFAVDDRSGTCMKLTDFATAISNKGLDVIGFDTCFGITMETICETKNASSYIVGTPGLSPNSGWNYKSFLSKFGNTSLETEDFTESLLSTQNQTTSCIKNSEIEHLRTAFDDFARKMALFITSRDKQEQIYDMLANQVHTYMPATFPCDKFLDVYDIAVKTTELQLDELKFSAETLMTAVSNTGNTNNSDYLQIGVFFITMLQRNVMNVSHEDAYIKGAREFQIEFVKDSLGWVPNLIAKEDSLLDKVFYTSF